MVAAAPYPDCSRRRNLPSAKPGFPRTERAVIAGLLYLPFGKFFHIFQRPAQLGVKLYQQAGAEDEGALCGRCGERFASKMHIDDLRQVLPQLGFDYSLGDGIEHWQALCPACKRKSVASAQVRMKESIPGLKEPMHG